MMKIIFSVVSVLALGMGTAYASGDWKHAKQMPWSFDGPFGHVDQQSAQRGLQVYREVCSACHGLKRIAFRNLEEIGFSKAEIKALSAEYSVADGPDDTGEMFERAGVPSDYFPSPYANENAARASNGGAYPPDLSLIIKARADGANYVYSLLTGYGEPLPEGMHLSDGQHYNPYFSWHTGIAMPAPLSDGQVSYEDGTEATVDQMSQDVVNFLQWAAEPEMQDRKQVGIKVIVFLFFFTLFMFFAYRNLWKKIH